MRVLLAEADIFSTVGGGQTIYQNLVRQRPDVEFWHFVTGSKAAANAPQNARAIPLISWNDLALDFGRDGHLLPALTIARRYARSVAAAGLEAFDVVDTPDYREQGLFLREALQAEGVAVGNVSLALHGTISSALQGAWPWHGDPRQMFAALQLRERLQRHTADTLYAISQAYADEVAGRTGRSVNLVDPVALIRETEATLAPQGGPPDLVFVGRREKRKGPDLFIDLAWMLPRNSYGEVRLIGEDGVNHQGRGGDVLLAEAAALRGLEVKVERPLGQSGLRDLCRSRTVLVVPSRYDQFNLVALEALLDGCPTIVSRKAGVSRWIETHLPSLSWLVADFSCDRGVAETARRVCENYDEVREEVVEAVCGAQLQPNLAAFERMYEPSTPGPSSRVQVSLRSFAQRVALATDARAMRPRPPAPRDPALQAGAAAVFATKRAGQVLRAQLDGARQVTNRLRSRLSREAMAARAQARIAAAYGIGRTAAADYALAGSVQGVRERLIYQPEDRGRQLREKIEYVRQVASERRLERVHWYGELARLEEAAGNELTAAVYQARLLRWLGSDRYGRLSDAQQILAEQGFSREAEVLPGMLDGGSMQTSAGRAYFDDQLARHLTLAKRPWERLVDRRDGASPRVSVIVSLYAAAAKSPGFLRLLRQQSLLLQGAVEVIFVDSGSPDDELAALEPVWAERPFPMIYGRSAKRETIQSAWNRGIGLARGDYLVFLGVDEGLRPDGLEQLAAFLERTPEVDWVMADSFITGIDRRGFVDHDVLAYVRTGLTPSWHYLDSTYLSYVGGMYRRAIHERVGYYDEEFRAAGDTEFKNRAMPLINIAHLPLRLGVFNDFPDARMTNHPRAEIEDLRAWYAHRTPAGMAYAFDEKPVEDVVGLLCASLSYRKAYKRDRSTDIDLTVALTRYLEEREPSHRWRRARGLAVELRDGLRRLDTWGTRYEGLGAQYEFATTFAQLRQTAVTLQRLLGGDGPPVFEAFNDNRYEQHFWVWRP